MEEKKNKNSPARIRANHKYNSKTYEYISVIVHKGEKAKIRSEAQKQGKSMNAYIVDAIREKMSNYDKS